MEVRERECVRGERGEVRGEVRRVRELRKPIRTIHLTFDTRTMHVFSHAWIGNAPFGNVTF